jgi:hypothetical protein
VFPFDVYECQIQSGIENVDVLLKPRSEIIGFMGPNLTKRNSLQFADGWRGHTYASSRLVDAEGIATSLETGASPHARRSCP